MGRGVAVRVSVGVGVNVRVGGGVNVSVAERLVDIAIGLGEAVGLPLVELQALVIRITKMSTYELLAFIFLLY
jgi:hypothetical protein